MQNIIIQMYKSGREKSEKVVIVPMSKIAISMELIPSDTKKFLMGEGIDITTITNLVQKKMHKTILIEIDKGKEKVEAINTFKELNKEYY